MPILDSFCWSISGGTTISQWRPACLVPGHCVARALR